MLDVDCILRRDVYVSLHSPPQSGAALIHLEEGFANGGLWYLRAPGSGAAGWTHDEVWRRGDAIQRLNHAPGGFSGTLMDQAMVNDALNGASDPNGSTYDWRVSLGKLFFVLVNCSDAVFARQAVHVCDGRAAPQPLVLDRRA